MDFLEGALLGPLWTDTDYEDRPHRGLRLLLSVLFWLGLSVIMFLINFRALSLNLLFGFPWFPLFLVLVFVSPFLAMVYYQMPVIIRFPILALQAAKHLGFFLAVYKLFLPYLRLNVNEIVAGLMSFSDNTIGRFIEFYTERYETAGMLIGTAILAILGILFFLIFLLVFVYLPQLLLLLLRQIQMIWDFTVRAFVRLTERRSKDVPPVPQTAMGPGQGPIPSQELPAPQPSGRRQEGAPGRASRSERRPRAERQAGAEPGRPSAGQGQQAERRQQTAGWQQAAGRQPAVGRQLREGLPVREELPPREELFQRHDVRTPRIREIQENQSEAENQDKTANQDRTVKESKEE